AGIGWRTRRRSRKKFYGRRNASASLLTFGAMAEGSRAADSLQHFRLASLKGFDGERVEASADGVDVDEGEGASVRAVCEKDEDALARRVNPATRSREAEVAETVGREQRACGRVGRGGEL